MKDFIAQAVVTESKPDADMHQRLSQHIRGIHGIMGLTTEVGELVDDFKRHIFYGQPLDVDNIAQEVSDLLWYIALLCDAYGFTIEDLQEKVIKKLRTRYGEKFSQYDALHRDLEAERGVYTRELSADEMKKDVVHVDYNRPVILNIGDKVYNNDGSLAGEVIGVESGLYDVQLGATVIASSVDRDVRTKMEESTPYVRCPSCKREVPVYEAGKWLKCKCGTELQPVWDQLGVEMVIRDSRPAAAISRISCPTCTITFFGRPQREQTCPNGHRFPSPESILRGLSEVKDA